MEIHTEKKMWHSLPRTATGHDEDDLTAARETITFDIENASLSFLGTVSSLLFRRMCNFKKTITCARTGTSSPLNPCVSFAESPLWCEGTCGCTHRFTGLAPKSMCATLFLEIAENTLLKWTNEAFKLSIGKGQLHQQPHHQQPQLSPSPARGGDDDEPEHPPRRNGELWTEKAATHPEINFQDLYLRKLPWNIPEGLSAGLVFDAPSRQGRDVQHQQTLRREHCRYPSTTPNV